MTDKTNLTIEEVKSFSGKKHNLKVERDDSDTFLKYFVYTVYDECDGVKSKYCLKQYADKAMFSAMDNKIPQHEKGEFYDTVLKIAEMIAENDVIISPCENS